MTAVIIPFPVKKARTDDLFDEYRVGLMAEHPQWDAAKVDRVAFLATHIDRAGILEKLGIEAVERSLEAS